MGSAHVNFTAMVSFCTQIGRFVRILRLLHSMVTTWFPLFLTCLPIMQSFLFVALCTFMASTVVSSTSCGNLRQIRPLLKEGQCNPTVPCWYMNITHLSLATWQSTHWLLCVFLPGSILGPYFHFWFTMSSSVFLNFDFFFGECFDGLGYLAL